MLMMVHAKNRQFWFSRSTTFHFSTFLRVIFVFAVLSLISVAIIPAGEALLAVAASSAHAQTQTASLRSLATARGFVIGAGDSDLRQLNDIQYA